MGQEAATLLLFFLVINSNQCDSIFVCPDLDSEGKSPAANNNDCSDTLNNTLTKLLRNDSLNDERLVLTEPGSYLLSGFFLINDIRNFTISGSSSDRNEYVISCINTERPAGLAFVNVSVLELTNITISNCGISGKELESTVSIIKNNLELFFRIPNQLQYGMIIADSYNVSIENTLFINTTGLGVLGINIGGTSSFVNLEFAENHASLCQYESLTNLTSDLTIGGGLFLLYTDYKDIEEMPRSYDHSELSIRECLFHRNRFCSSFNVLSAYYGQSVTANRVGYIVGSAAGMGIALAQLHYSVNISIESSVFTNNTGLYNAGVHIGIFEGVDMSNVQFSNCNFTNNGYSDENDLPFGLHSQSGGLSIYDNLYFPNETLRNLCLSGVSEFPAQVHVINSLFSKNQAYSCNALSVRSYRSTLVTSNNLNIFQFTNTSFIDNQGSVGTVACASATEFSGFNPSFKFIFEDVTIANNTVITTNNGISNQIVESSGQILLASVNLTLNGKCVFTNNYGVPLVAYSSLIHFSGSSSFIGNRGVFGGAIRLVSQSYLIIKNDSELLFANNTATVEGGAIFFYAPSLYSANPFADDTCFLYFDYVDLFCNYSICPNVSTMNINVSFIGNSAKSGGSIFGSTLNSCPWHYSLMNGVTSKADSALHFLSDNFPSKFHFDPPLNSANTSVVSTQAVTLQFSKEPILASPGQRVRRQAKAFDGFGYPTSTAIQSTSAQPDSVSTTLGNAVYYFINSADLNGTSVPIDVTGQENQSASVELFSVNSGAQIIITVNTSYCGPGFVYDNTALACVCIPELEAKGVKCNASQEVLVIPDNHWFGYFDDRQSILVYSNCFYDYCKPSSMSVNVFDLDFQCNTHYRRTGLACGKCEPNTSTVFGTSRCVECSNIGLLWIPGFAIAGIIMVLSISFLGVTIAEGYLNGFIFYCNSLNYFFVYLYPRYPYDPVFSPAAWINLNLGIESCFFDGMTSVHRIGLRFLFPLYLFIIMGFIVLLGKKIKKFPNLKFSASKTFATLILLCYFNIAGTCIEAMASTTYTSVYGNFSQVRWNLDPTIPFGYGFHVALIVLSVLLLLAYIIPFSILFLFPRILYGSRFTNKFKPIYDAFWNPFKPRFRLWLSIRAMLRFIPFSLALFSSYPTNVLVMVIFISILWFTHERLMPFDGYWQNSFDSFFMLNLMLLFVSNIFFERYRDTSADQINYPVAYKVIVYMLLISAYIAFLIIIVIHLFIRFPKLKEKMTRRAKRIKSKFKKTESMSNLMLSINSNESDEDENTSESAPTIVQYSEFREPLLDEYGTIPIISRKVIQ